MSVRLRVATTDRGSDGPQVQSLPRRTDELDSWSPRALGSPAPGRRPESVWQVLVRLRRGDDHQPTVGRQAWHGSLPAPTIHPWSLATGEWQCVAGRETSSSQASCSATATTETMLGLFRVQTTDRVFGRNPNVHHLFGATATPTTCHPAASRPRAGEATASS